MNTISNYKFINRCITYKEHVKKIILDLNCVDYFVKSDANDIDYIYAHKLMIKYEKKQQSSI